LCLRLAFDLDCDLKAGNWYKLQCMSQQFEGIQNNIGKVEKTKVRN